MSLIHKAQITLAGYSSMRTKKKMSAKALKEAFFAGADFLAMSLNGRPCQTYCTIRDFAVGASVEIMESDGTFMCSVSYFTLEPSIDPQANDIPAFANGHPIELD